LHQKNLLKKWEVELLIQMIKRLYKKIFHYILVYGFQNLSKSSSFVLMGSHYLLCKKNQSTKNFSKYNESIIIWYGLWRWVFGTSKVQYVMVTQNLFMKFIQCDHITYNIIFWNPFHILFIYILFHHPWLIIQQVVTRLCIPP
jgi:hypothetical protein